MSDFEQFRKHANDQDVFNVPGGLTGGAPPVPIPNTEVKPSKADDTAAARPWESRTLPGYKRKPAGEIQRAFLFVHPGWFIIIFGSHVPDDHR